MFPDFPPKLIKKKLRESEFDAKKCIELLTQLKEKKSSNKSLEIEEWSDGDENIRAKNIENKLKRLSNESEEEPIDKKRKSTLNDGLLLFYFE